MSRAWLALAAALAVFLATGAVRAAERDAKPRGPAPARRAEPAEAEDEAAAQHWRAAPSPRDYLETLGKIQDLRAQRESKPAAAQFISGYWISIGPNGSQGTAQPTDEVNGRIRSIYIRPQGGSYYIYAGAGGGGLWRALGSNGHNGPWTNLGDRLPNPAVGAFAVHPNNPDDIIVGTGDFNRYTGAGLFHTTNAGATWAPVPIAGTFPQAVFRLFYLPNDPNVILAATDAGLLRSVNGVWSLPLDGQVTDLLIHPTNPNIMFAMRSTDLTNGGGGLYKSTDAGVTWAIVSTTAVPTNLVGLGCVALDPVNPSSLALVYELGGNIAGVRRSPDGGATWSDITRTMLGLGNSQSNHALAIAIRPNQPNEIYIGSNQMWRSTDSGATWQRIVDPVMRHQDQTQLYFSPVTGWDTMWYTNDGGLFRYDAVNGTSESWNGTQQTGLCVSWIYDMDAVREIRVGALQDDGSPGSLNDGVSWTPFTCCDVYDHVITNDLLPTYWWERGGGVTRQRLTGDATDVSDPGRSVFSLFCDHTLSTVYALSSNMVVSRSSAASSRGSWTVETNLPVGQGALDGSYLNGQTLFAWGNPPGTLWVLRKSGATWSIQPQVITNATSRIYTVFASRENDLESWAGLAAAPNGPKVLHTTDGWQTWSDVSGNLTSMALGNVNTIAVAPFDSREIYIGTDLGVFYTQDSGGSWWPLQNGLPIVRVMGLKYLAHVSTTQPDDRIIAATYGHGMYQLDLQRPATNYVDPRAVNGDGSYEHPLGSFYLGYTNVPDGGVLGLNGQSSYLVGAGPLTKPVTLKAYEGRVLLSP